MKTVCVTGASGYIASWLVKFLLQRGYTVKASVRDPNDPKKAEHLLALEGAKERLHFIKANLLEEGSFDAVVDGCDGVFHTASPAYFETTDPQQWYMLSKTLAEDAAWKFVKENGIDMVAINPSMVMGPLLQPTLNTSSASILNLINGAKTYPNVTAGWVNVKDVANAYSGI
ncbi:UNVERIFIED_CONTAM: Cinnamoyl-CoA reductase 1 [Sesamum angustifolium]|uniref:Cinnamoyl-CoA reductase 1 n=1 Tax=Sesamum angustifolium TaxID=2727405 RepID=A0AAW2QTF9_9LAMI